MKRIFFACLLLSGCSVFSLNEENDIFGITENRDMMYSNGTRFTYTTKESETPEIIKKIADPIPSLQVFGESIKPNRYTVEAGQEMYTPDNITSFELQKDQNPFVGYLYGKVGKEEITTEYRKFSFFSLGTVGPSSLADKTQKFVHKQIGMQKPNGWVNQIDNEPVFVHESGIDLRDIQVNCDSFRFDQTSGYNMKIGTWYTGIEFNITHRFGQNYEMFSASPNSDWSWHFFNKPYLQLVAKDMTMDGNTFHDSHSVDRIPHVYGNEFGTILEFKGYALKLYIKTQSKLYEEQDKDWHTFGGFKFMNLFDLY